MMPVVKGPKRIAVLKTVSIVPRTEPVVLSFENDSKKTSKLKRIKLTRTWLMINAGRIKYQTLKYARPAKASISKKTKKSAVRRLPNRLRTRESRVRKRSVRSDAPA